MNAPWRTISSNAKIERSEINGVICEDRNRKKSISSPLWYWHWFGKSPQLWSVVPTVYRCSSLFLFLSPSLSAPFCISIYHPLLSSCPPYYLCLQPSLSLTPSPSVLGQESVEDVLVRLNINGELMRGERVGGKSRDTLLYPVAYVSVLMGGCPLFMYQLTCTGISAGTEWVLSCSRQSYGSQVKDL